MTRDSATYDALRVIVALTLILALVAVAWWLIISGWHGAQDDGASTWEMVKIIWGGLILANGARSRNNL